MKVMSLNSARPEDLVKEYRGIRGMSEDYLKSQILLGGRFVCYLYCISGVYFTNKLESKPYFIRAGQSRFFKGLPFTLLTLIAGWWAIPFGPVYTIECLAKNFSGGEDVTASVTTGACVAARIAHRKATEGSQ